MSGLELVDFRVDTALVDESIGFNEWARAVEDCLEAESRSQWYLGDLWNFGRDRFAKDYHAGMERLALQHGTLVQYARVARIFPPRRTHDRYARLDGVSFSHHVVAATIVDPEERIGWLEDAALHKWSARKLVEEIQNAGRGGLPPVKQPALPYRAVGELYDLAMRASKARGLEPRDWVEQAIREKAARDLGLGIGEAA